MFVAIAVPATVAGAGGVSTTSPTVGSTPPGPTAAIRTPPTSPISASRVGTATDTIPPWGRGMVRPRHALTSGDIRRRGAQ